MMKSKLEFLACMFIPLFIFLAIVPVSSGIAGSGVLFVKDVAPGQYVSHTMNVKLSESESPTDVQVDVVGYGQSLTGVLLSIDASHDTSPYTARNFLTVFPRSFHLEPGISQNLLLEGIIPMDAEGGRYAIVDIHTRPKRVSPISNNSAIINTNVAIAVPVRLTISGTEQIKTGEITNLSVSGEEQKDVSVTFKNTGNYHYKALAKAVLKDEDENILANASTSPTYASIIPTYSRLFKLSLSPDSELQPGTYYVNATVC
ncbi:MAG: COG1470 family protein, partial [Methanotrichaceae archaeon]